jgi:hypothetical protein
LIQWSTTAGDPWFTPDEMQKIVAKDAAAGEARKKVEDDYEMAAMIKDNLMTTGITLKRKIFFFGNSGLMKQRRREGKRGATQRWLNRR